MYYVNPNLFFIFENGSFCLWKYKDHEQFEINKELVDLLIDISEGKDTPEKHPLLDDLIENDVISKTPYKMFPWGWDRLSHIFHMGTQNVPELLEKRTKQEMISDFIGFSKEYAQRKSKKAPQNQQQKISLSKVDENMETLSLLETAKKRLTSRHFSGKSLPEKSLSTILYYTFGECLSWDNINENVQLMGTRKTSPSAGGIHSIEAFVVIFNVEGLESGLYLYDSQDHTMTPIHFKADYETLIPLMADQFYLKGLSFGVFFVSDMTKVWEKYLHSRAYREIFLDAGHLSQMMQLWATSLGHNTWISGYFRDNDLIDYLKIKEETQAPLLFVGVGHGERTPLHPDMEEALKKT